MDRHCAELLLFESEEKVAEPVEKKPQDSSSFERGLLQGKQVRFADAPGTG